MPFEPSEELKLFLVLRAIEKAVTDLAREVRRQNKRMRELHEYGEEEN
jgi:hypothetical protein